MIGRSAAGAFGRYARGIRPRRTGDSPRSWPDMLDHSAQRLAELGIRTRGPFDLDRFLAELVQLRDGREIVLSPISVRAGSVTVCGYCLILERWDHVFYAQSRSRLHRTHNAVHELAHLLLGHASVAPLPPAGTRAEQEAGWLGVADLGYSERSEDEADAAAAVLLGAWREPARRSWAAHSALRRGAARLGDAYT
jgi:hypothetical protein